MRVKAEARRGGAATDCEYGWSQSYDEYAMREGPLTAFEAEKPIERFEKCE